MRYLLDTNVLSEPVRGRPDQAVLEQLEEHSGQVCTASVVLHELRYGAARLPDGRRKQAVERYLDDVVARLEVLSFDRHAALWHATARAGLEARGRATSFADAQIAAVAAVNDLVVVTRNAAHFEPFEVEVATWHAAPGGPRGRPH